jgi:hypothetical protein
MAVSKTSGTRYYIGPVVDTDAIQALTDEDAVTYFEGLSWTEVEEIESFGSFGDTAATVSFASVKDRRMRKYKTTRDGGTMAIVCGRDPLDAGQIALAAAERTDFNYAFKVVFADHRDADHTDSVEYFGGMVISRPTNLGGVGDITKQDFNVEVNTAIYAVPSDSSVVPVNLVLPSIIGAQVRVGYTLTAIEGEWTGEPTSLPLSMAARCVGQRHVRQRVGGRHEPDLCPGGWRHRRLASGPGHRRQRRRLLDGRQLARDHPDHRGLVLSTSRAREGPPFRRGRRPQPRHPGIHHPAGRQHGRQGIRFQQGGPRSQ